MRLESKELDTLRDMIHDKRCDTIVIIELLHRYLREIAIMLDELQGVRGENRDH